MNKRTVLVATALVAFLGLMLPARASVDQAVGFRAYAKFGDACGSFTWEIEMYARPEVVYSGPSNVTQYAVHYRVKKHDSNCNEIVYDDRPITSASSWSLAPDASLDAPSRAGHIHIDWQARNNADCVINRQNLCLTLPSDPNTVEAVADRDAKILKGGYVCATYPSNCAVAPLGADLYERAHYQAGSWTSVNP